MLATTLLAAAVPVACAWAVHWLGRLGLLNGVEIAGRSIDLFWTIAALATGIVAVCWLLRPVTTVWRSIRDGLDATAAYASIVAAVAIIVAATPWAVASLGAVTQWQLASLSLASIATILSGSLVVKAIGARPQVFRKALSRLFILSGAVLFVIAYLATIQLLGLTQAPGSVATQIVGVVLVVWLLWASAINLNLTGLHRYYRDRLASCYLQDPPAYRGIAHPPLLENLSAKLPYHLINTTVNLASSANPELRGRGGDFFLISKEICGSTITGFQKTGEVSKLKRGPRPGDGNGNLRRGCIHEHGLANDARVSRAHGHLQCAAGLLDALAPRPSRVACIQRVHSAHS